MTETAGASQPSVVGPADDGAAAGAAVPRTDAKAPRYSQLDSMRGLAALTVVFLHFRLMWLGRHPGFNPNPIVDGVLVTPFTSGRPAVIFFFLLSGFVLSIPILRGKRQHYIAFVSRRILRIYGPYLAALALAILGDAIWHGQISPNEWSAGTWFQPVTAEAVLQHVLFIGNYNWGEFNTAFWSLVIEMRISLIFPFLLLMVQKAGKVTTILVATAILIVIPMLDLSHPSWAPVTGTVLALGVFAAGILLADHREELILWYRGLSSGARALIVCFSFFFYEYGLLAWKTRIRAVWRFEQVFVVLGAAGLLVVALASLRAAQWLTRPLPHFLGNVSYSLYLVHGTVLFAITAAAAGYVRPSIQFPLYLVISVALATAFWFMIERPLTRLSQRVGNAIDAALLRI